MKIVSPIYANQALRFGDSVIEFKNGTAEVSEELFKEIQSSNFPNIYAEGKSPGIKAKANEDFDKTIKELNTEYMEEIDRLKKVNAARVQENSELRQQLENLKAVYDKDIKDLQSKLITKVAEVQNPIPETSTENSEPNEEEEVRKDLEAMKLPELQKIAVDQGSNLDSLKKLTKKELIDVIMGKTE